MNQKNKIVFFVETILRPYCTKPISTSILSPQANTHTRKHPHGNSNNSTRSIGEDLKLLCKQARLEGTMDTLLVMNQRGIQPGSYIYASLLQGCVNMKALPEGKLVHAHIIQTGFNPDVFLATKLVIMYAKCGSLMHAHLLLDQMPEKNAVSWTVIIAAYTRHGFDEEALTLFYQMQRTGIQPDQFTFASVLPAFANLASLEQGKEIHEHIHRSGFHSNLYVESALIDMYVKCRSIDNARKVFDKMPERNVVSWTALIAGYAQNGYVDEALELFWKMPRRDLVSCNVMIAGYAQNGYVDEALKLFQEMPERDAVSWNAMIAGYAQNGFLDDALKLLQKMPEQNLVSWNTMIAAYAKHGRGDEAVSLFYEMQQRGIQPDQLTFVSALSACANLASLEHGKKIHEFMNGTGFQCNVLVGSALVDMYAKCASVENARNVFDRMPDRNVVTWNIMIAGYAQNGHVDEALELFIKMPERNVVSWNAMVAGYAHNGRYYDALKLFQQMQLTGLKPNLTTIASVLPACANLAPLQQGKEVHKDIIKSGFQSDVIVGSALVDMYAKCGNIEDAHRVFDSMPKRDVVSWTAMIVGYAMHGRGEEAIQLFEQMQHYGTKPNHVTLVGVLSACCHAGLVDDGWRYFDQMSRDYHITPTVEHYCCMVDLLGRAGHLDEAQDFINKMPIKPDAAVWGSLLGGCRIHANTELGERAADCLLESDPKNAAHYVLLSNIYAASGRWDDIEKLRKIMKDRRIKKMPGCSWIEVNNKVYAFVVGDKSHPQMKHIYAKLDSLSGQMKDAGYVPDTNFVLHDVEEEQKEHILFHHSEKLAIAFGLINMSPVIPIRIVKNLRVCGDCHSAIKFISKIVAREIVVRDANRFHHFEDGQCSCGDYW
eukprot:Gb_27491 [translate_table: standard]